METNKIEDSIGYLVEHLSRSMRRFAASVLREKKIELTLEQIAVLTILHERGSKHQNELAEIMSKDNPTLTRILDGLEKKSLLKREISQNDRRRFLIVLTPLGIEKRKETIPVVNEIRQILFRQISRKHTEALLEIKQLIENNISEYKSD